MEQVERQTAKRTHSNQSIAKYHLLAVLVRESERGILREGAVWPGQLDAAGRCCQRE